MIVLLKRNWKVENLGKSRNILIVLLKRNWKVENLENLGKY